MVTEVAWFEVKRNKKKQNNSQLQNAWMTWLGTITNKIGKEWYEEESLEDDLGGICLSDG